MDVNSLLALLDSRKIGKLSVDNVLSFLQLLSNAPGIDDCAQTLPLLRHQQTPASSTAQAFSGLLNALEALLNRPTSAITKEFLAKQFEKVLHHRLRNLQVSVRQLAEAHQGALHRQEGRADGHGVVQHVPRVAGASIGQEQPLQEALHVQHAVLR